MTNKNLSRKLCEVCGIKYKLYYDSVKFEYVWLTKEEVELYTNQKLTELQTKNANAVANAGYSFSKITSEYGELPVYVKDGKTFMVNMDGTVGQEIIPEGPENEN